MQKYCLFFFLAISFILVETSCKSDYQKIVDQELASGKRNDNLFLGMYFGMTRDSFYSHCFALNRAGVITNGAFNVTALLKIQRTNPPIDFNFYPKFNQENKMVMMETTFSYTTWAPWNTQFHSDKIVRDAITILNSWYPEGQFINFQKDQKQVWVKINGNRQIKGFIKNSQYLQFDIKDLTASMDGLH